MASMFLQIPDPPAVKHYTSIGRCIYCPSKTNLTDEHIIPLALRGTLIFVDGSCTDCARAVNPFETYCLRKTFIDVRRHMNLKGRKHKKSPPPPPRLGVFARPGGEFVRWEDVDLEKDPFMFVLPTISVPTILLNQPPSKGFTLEGFNLFSAPDAFDILGSAGKGIGKVQNFHFEHFSRFIAKVAHGAAVAELGLDACEWFLPPYIRAEMSGLSHYVGSWSTGDGSSRSLHELTILDIDDFVTVIVRLFAKLSSPSYIAVVGRRKLLLSRQASR